MSPLVTISTKIPFVDPRISFKDNETEKENYLLLQTYSSNWLRHSLQSCVDASFGNDINENTSLETEKENYLLL